MIANGSKSVPALIMDAIKQGDLIALEALLQKNPEQLHFKMPVGSQTWLGYAAGHGSAAVVRKLLSLGFDVNEGSVPDDIKPLSSACHKGRHEIASILLEAGAVLETATAVQNPLFAAIVGRSPEVVRLLLERGLESTVRYNTTSMDSMDAVAFALMRGETECARVIAMWNARGDETAVKAALDEGMRIAKVNAYRSH